MLEAMRMTGARRIATQVAGGRFRRKKTLSTDLRMAKAPRVKTKVLHDLLPSRGIRNRKMKH